MVLLMDLFLEKFLKMTDEEDWKKMFENPEKILVSAENYDKFVEMLELPSEATMESIKRLMNRKTPWDEPND